ncbi:MAG: hypothetical protein GX138_04130 [Firmicutes bacterium]|nr:hypothetical protein [Bacillota bacterium]
MKIKPFFWKLIFFMFVFLSLYLFSTVIASETITSVDGGTSSLGEIIDRYKGFVPLLIGLVFIGFRRKFFPSSHDKK